MKNSINTYPYDIAAIILAYLRNEIDEKGQQKLDAWLEEADSHKALFARIQDEGMQYEDIQKILSYDAGGAWQIVKQKAVRRKRKRLMRVYQVAASVVVILGVAIAFLLKEEATVVPVAKVEEKLSLAERFGLWLSFYPFTQAEYLQVLDRAFEVYPVPEAVRTSEELRLEALQWAIERGGRSGRVAMQFAKLVSAREALKG